MDTINAETEADDASLLVRHQDHGIGEIGDWLAQYW